MTAEWGLFEWGLGEWGDIGAPGYRLDITSPLVILVNLQNVGPILGHSLTLSEALPLTVTFNDVTLAASWGLAPTTAVYVVTFNSVVLLRGRTLSPTTTTYAVTFNAVTLNAPGHLNPTTTTYVVTFNSVILLAICSAP